MMMCTADVVTAPLSCPEMGLQMLHPMTCEDVTTGTGASLVAIWGVEEGRGNTEESDALALPILEYEKPAIDQGQIISIYRDLPYSQTI